MNNINVFSGPMKCGKSQKILDEAGRQKIAGRNFKIFKPAMDDRFGSDFIADRNGNKLKAINIASIDELSNYDADVYLIDEFQFLDGNIETIQKLADKGKKFYIAGLNLTAEKKPFGKMGDLLCCSDNVTMMTSICEICKNDNAIYSFCTADKTGAILIGDSEYIPVCSSCYSKLMSQRLENNNNNNNINNK